MADTMDYTPDLYTLVDEEGKEQTFEMLDALESDGERYFALVPYYAEGSELETDDGELVILKSQMEGEEEILVSIEDDDEFDKIGAMFMQRIEEMFEGEDDDCECGHCGCDCGCDHE